MTDIVERLRGNARWLERDGFSTSARNTTEAADEIERLRAELDALKPDPKCDVSCIFSCHGEGRHLAEEVERLRTELDKERQRRFDGNQIASEEARTESREQQNEIDRLRAEVARRAETLQAERDYVASLHEQIDAKRVEMAATNAAYKQVQKDCANLTEKVIPNLRAELDALRGQEPVAYRYRSFSPFGKHEQSEDWTLIEAPSRIDSWSAAMGAVLEPLFLAPHPGDAE